MISWRWLIVVAVVFWNLGFDIRGRMDRKLINILNETVDGCIEILDKNPHHRETKPELWVSIDTKATRA